MVLKLPTTPSPFTDPMTQVHSIEKQIKYAYIGRRLYMHDASNMISMVQFSLLIQISPLQNHKVLEGKEDTVILKVQIQNQVSVS